MFASATSSSEGREIVADALAQGRRFTRARVREVESVLARDVAEARATNPNARGGADSNAQTWGASL